MKKDYTIIDRKKLFEYLDIYSFVNDDEIEMAICDFIEKQEWVLYYSDCAFAYDLMNDYKEYLDNQN